jgi:hypothetical protein
MKKFILIMLISAIGMIGFAQVSKIPQNVQSQFSTSYPNVSTTEWKVEGSNYNVRFFDQMNRQQVVVYNNDAKVIRREAEIERSRIPVTISDYYRKTYPAEKNYTIWSVTDDRGNITYYSPYNDQYLYFDKQGKFLRQEKMPPNRY